MMRKILIELQNLIYPNKCTLCREILNNNTKQVLCDKCYSHLLKEHLCNRCGRPYKIGQEGCLCCTPEEEPLIERIVGLFPYRDECRESVLVWNRIR